MASGTCVSEAVLLPTSIDDQRRRVARDAELVAVYMTQLIPSGGLDDHGRLRALIYQAIAD